MNKALLVLLFCILTISQSASHSKPLKIVAMSKYPFSCNIEKEGTYGYAISTLIEIFGPLGFEVQVSILPYARAIKRIENKNADIIVGILPLNSHQFASSEIPIGYFEPAIAYPKKQGEYDFWGYPVIGRMGYIDQNFFNQHQVDFVEHLKEKQLAMSIEGEEELLRLLKMVGNGHIDYFFEDFQQLYSAIQKFGFQHLISLKKLKNEPLVPLLIGVNPQSANRAFILQNYERGMTELIKSGKLQTILFKHKLKNELIDRMTHPE